MEINRETCRAIRDTIQGQTSDWMKANGLKLEIGKITYSENNLVAKVSVSKVSADGTVMTKEAEAFKRYCDWNGIPKSALWQTFEDGNGTLHQIVGWNPRARKRPVLTKASDGRNYSWPAKIIAQKMGGD